MLTIGFILVFQEAKLLPEEFLSLEGSYTVPRCLGSELEVTPRFGRTLLHFQPTLQGKHNWHKEHGKTLNYHIIMKLLRACVPMAKEGSSEKRVKRCPGNANSLSSLLILTRANETSARDR